MTDLAQMHIHYGMELNIDEIINNYNYPIHTCASRGYVIWAGVYWAVYRILHWGYPNKNKFARNETPQKEEAILLT